MATRGEIRNRLPLQEIDERPKKWRKYPHLFLIVCEDEKTEPLYFKKFKEIFNNIYPKETVFLCLVGTGRNSKGVVEQAIIKKKELFEESNKTVDETWVVFDKDDLEQSEGNRQRFMDAFEIAEKENINIAYSNEVFELWFLLHFANINSKQPIPRSDIFAKLEEKIKKHPPYSDFVYEHGKSDIVDIVLKIGNEKRAIERADRINSEHETKKNQPIDANPNTRVNILVKRLRALIAYYSYEL